MESAFPEASRSSIVTYEPEVLRISAERINWYNQVENILLIYNSDRKLTFMQNNKVIYQ